MGKRTVRISANQLLWAMAGLPEDTAFVRAKIDKTGDVLVVVESAEWEATPAGEVYPEIWVDFATADEEE